jgi:hypothetical protein
MSTTYGKAVTYPTKNHGKLITPEILVAHTTEGGSKEWLDGLFRGAYGRGDGVNVSVHWAVYKDGSIVEYAPWRPGEAVACWHAGQSLWNNRKSCNYFSLGYEIQHKWGEPYPDVQVQSIIFLNRMVKSMYPNIEYVTHAQIAYPRGRKTDPTEPWAQIAPRIMAAWNATTEEDMPIDNVSVATAQPEIDRLVKAGIITKPEAHELSDAAGVGLLFTIAGRIAEAAGLVPKS